MNANASNFDPSGFAGGEQGGYYQQTENVDGYFESRPQPSFEGYQGSEYFPTYPQESNYYNAHQQFPVDSEYGEYSVGQDHMSQQKESGYYFLSGQFTPQIYSAPVSAIAYDDFSSAMYVASHTQPFGERPRRASMLVTHNVTDGMLYSSCAGHPECEPSVLQYVYRTFYGGNHEGADNPHARVPAHAYRPPYGVASMQPQTPQIGITTLLPSSGHVLSVSPAGVRFHNKGGLCVCDNEIEGMVSGTPHPSHESRMTHVSVGGVPVGGRLKTQPQLHCLDIYQNLKIISSSTIKCNKTGPIGIMAIQSNHQRQSLVAGCSDGMLRFFDASWRSKSGSVIAQVASHTGGVSDVTVSEDGNLVCTVGFGAKASSTTTLYAYPDPHLMVYDVRYLGRGGIIHPFAGLKGGPRFVKFIPQVRGHPSNRLIAASGQPGGGLQIITPFESPDENPANFFFAQLEPNESITSLSVAKKHLALGTSLSKIHQFELSGILSDVKAHIDADAMQRSFGAVLTSPSDLEKPEEGKQGLELPDFIPPRPMLSIHPGVLQAKTGGGRIGTNERLKSVFTSYIMRGTPSISKHNPKHPSKASFGTVGQSPMVPSGTRSISQRLLSSAEKADGDVMNIVQTRNLGLDLFANHSSRQRGKKLLANPNKLIHSSAGNMYFAPDTRRRLNDSVKKIGGGRKLEDILDDQGLLVIPDRYQLTTRPSFASTSHFDHSQYNDTGLWPGCDYPQSMPSAHVPSVLLMLFFLREARTAALQTQGDTRLFSSKTVEQVPALSTELGLLFHHIESISTHGLVYGGGGTRPRVGVFVPTNFLTRFTTMQEAEQLALLDNNPAVADRARRPEAFYRFILYHLDKELPGQGKHTLQMDALHGLDFVSANEFVTGTGPPTVSSTRALTIDLSYEPFIGPKSPLSPRFGEVLLHALCRETKLRAWCKTTASYETIVQRRIATSLPRILSLSCSCAGRKVEEGLCVWRTNLKNDQHWLPEFIELELEVDGKVVVREQNEDNSEAPWVEFRSSSKISSLPPQIARKDKDMKDRRVRYQLQSVLSFIPDQSSQSSSSDADRHGVDGHHVLHMRIPKEYKRRALRAQLKHAESFAKTLQGGSDQLPESLTLTQATDVASVEKRMKATKERLDAISKSSSDWVLFNGFVVSSTEVDDARAFHVSFKEPCIVVYRAIEDTENVREDRVTHPVSPTVMFSRSISTGKISRHSVKHPGELPGRGDIVAFDAEFVSSQEEESVLNDLGNKVTLRNTRHALARVSVIDCRSGNVLIDDYVLPREPVVDYLTRFSGIVASDLDPKNSPHHLVTTRTAYLKLRCLMERGCIFLGHGLSQDFRTVNLFVPPSQVIDTVEVYHKEHMRYISLRFLANYVLHRDMQQDVHDSIEDARAAYELYKHALGLHKTGSFEGFLDKLYDHGKKTDWRIGVEESV